ncbi:MAG: cytochrome c [Proteobacteria bacterium]|nr:cytochrome c [Pseudomonadota bacterium]
MKLSTWLATGLVATVALATTAVVAQQDPIATRKDLMKANGRNAGVIVKMVKGEEAYDPAKVKAAFDQWDETASKFGALFPDSSKEGDTRALPAVWTERAKFDAAIAKFKKDVDDNRAKAMSGADGLKVALGAVGKNCGDCHEAFRKPQ